MTPSQPTAANTTDAPDAPRTGPGVPGPRHCSTTGRTSPGRPQLHGVAIDPPTPAPSITDLTFILNDASQRARAILAGEPAPDADSLVDAVRLLSAESTEARATQLAQSSGLTAGEIRLLRTAHRCGGDAAVRVALYPWHPGHQVLQQAAEQIAVRGLARRGVLHRDDNRLTDHGASTQIRLGTDGNWYPFSGNHGTWVAAPGASPDPCAALTAAITARRARTS